MSGARKTLSTASATVKRQVAGRANKAAQLQHHNTGKNATGDASANQSTFTSQLQPAIDLPFLRSAWTWAASSSASAESQSDLITSLAAQYLQAKDMPAQFARMNALTTAIIEQFGGKKDGKKKGATAEVSAPAVAAPQLPNEVRASLILGLFDFLTLKLQTSTRGSILQAIELLDGPAAGESTLVSDAIDTMIKRMQDAPAIGLAVWLDQTLSWKVGATLLPPRMASLIPAATSCMNEIVVQRFRNIVPAVSVDTDANEDEEEESGSSSSASILFMTPSEQSRFLLRAIVACILRGRKDMQSIFARVQSGSDENTNQLRTNLQAFVQTLVKIMLHPSVHRDVLTQIGLILTVIIHLSCLTCNNKLTEAQIELLTAQAFYHTFFDPSSGSGNSQVLASVPILAWIQSSGSSSDSSNSPLGGRDFESKLHPMARLAFYRSIATQLSLPILLNSVNPSSSSLNLSNSLLLNHLCPLIYQSCKSLNPHIRAYSFQCVEIIFAKCKSYIQTALKAQATPMKDAVIVEMERYISSVLDLLYSNFDHPFKAIPSVARALFLQYIELRNLLLNFQGAADAETQKTAREEYWSQFIGSILHRNSAEIDAKSSSSSSSTTVGYNTSSRGVFTMLNYLLPHISVASLLRHNPDLLQSLFNSAKFRPLFGITNQLIESLLGQAKEEMITASKFESNDAMEEDDAESAPVDGSEVVKRSKQKRRKDEIKKRLKAKAVEAGLQEADETSEAANADVNMTPAAPQVVSAKYQSQLTAWRSLWINHIVSALLSNQAMWRSDVSTCTLTHIFKQLDANDDSLDFVLRSIGSSSSSDVPSSTATRTARALEQEQRELSLKKSRALITVLKTARRLGMITSKDLDARIRVDDQEQSASSSSTPSAADTERFLPVTSSQLLSALLHTDLDLRLEVLEFLCSNLQSTELISSLEFRLLRASLPYLLKIGTPNVRAKFVHAVQRFVLRVRDSVNRELREEIMLRERATIPPNQEQDRAAFRTQPQLFDVISLRVFHKIESAMDFFAWFERFLFDSLYPSAPFERTCGVLELYCVILDGFIAPSSGEGSLALMSSAARSKQVQPTNAIPELEHWALRDRILTPEKTRVLVSLLASNWERVRLVAFDVLDRFPTPLPGYEGVDSKSSLTPLLHWCASLCRSARMRDAEGGSLALQLLFKKYVVGLRWKVDYHAFAMFDAAAAPKQDNSVMQVAESSHDAILYFMNSLYQYVQFQIQTLRASPLATRYVDPHSRVHGSLLVFRKTMSEMPWANWSSLDEATTKAWRDFTDRMITCEREVAEISLSLHISTNAAAALRSEAQTINTSTSMDCRGHPILANSEAAPAGDDFADQAGEQIVVVASWLAVKEVSLSLGGWVASAPLPTAARPNGGLFTLDQLRSVGSLFFAILSCSKHNGVLENSHAGFLSVCSTLVAHADPAQTNLVDSWLQSLMALIANPFENDSWIRRSRGIAYCLLAILQAEPAGLKHSSSSDDEHPGDALVSPGNSDMSGMSMLSRCMSELMRMAKTDTDSAEAIAAANGRTDTWKLKVHGLNILRAIFRDSVLAVDALPYIARALTIAIEGFAHTNWNVRNASLITFGALLSKAVRAQVRNNGVQQNEDNDTATSVSTTVGAKSGMTASDFFNHFPLLHGFLLEQLRIATAGTKTSSTATSDAMKIDQDAATVNTAAPAEWGSDMHPSLYPILLLLSRLVPSSSDDATASGNGEKMDMHAFLPFIRHCSAHPYYMARWMGAKAVVSLIPVQKLSSFIASLLLEFPTDPAATFSHNHLHGMLLQLHTLLHFHHYDSNLMSSEDKKALALELLPRFFDAKRVWIATFPSMKCALIRLLYLQVLEILMEYAETGSATAATERKKLIMLCASACDSTTTVSGQFEGVSVDVLQSQAVAILIRSICCLEPSTISAPSVDFTGLLLALSSEVHSLQVEESLLWTLKRCFALYPQRMVRHLDFNRITQHILSDKLIAHWQQFQSTDQSTYTIQELSFQILTAYYEFKREQDATSVPLSILAPYWQQILAYTVRSNDTSVKSASFTLLSVYLNMELDNLLSSPSDASLRTVLQHATTWLELAQNYMDDEQPVVLRYAVVRALQSTGLLKAQVQRSDLALVAGSPDVEASRVLPPPVFSSTSPFLSSTIAHRSLRSICITLWCSVILHLLQDENETVRVDASTLVGELVESRGSVAASNKTPYIHDGQVLVTRVLEQAFAYLYDMYWMDAQLASHVSHILRFYAQNFESAFDKTNAVALLPSVATTTSNNDTNPTAFKLFEHEKANTAIEELILLELSSHYLTLIYSRQIATPNVQQAATEQFVSQFSACFTSFRTHLSTFDSNSSSTLNQSWVGGVSFLEETFIKLYGEILAFASMIRVVATHKQLAQHHTIAAALKQFHEMKLDVVAQQFHPLLKRAFLGLHSFFLRSQSDSALAVSTNIEDRIGFLTHVSDVRV